MSDALARFLVDLASDPERMRRYAEDPGAEIQLAGLSIEHRTALLSKDANQIRHALGRAHDEHMTQIGQKPKRKRKSKVKASTTKRRKKAPRSKKGRK